MKKIVAILALLTVNTGLFAAAGPSLDEQLIAAVKVGNVTEVQKLINEGVNINVINEEEGTPLQVAAINGNKEIVDLLLKAGADIDASDVEGGLTPLHVAASIGNKDVVELLIKAGADIEAKYKLTPLYIAAYQGHKDVVELLIKAGADIEAKGDGKKTPLYVAAYGGHKEVAELLIRAGAKLSQELTQELNRELTHEFAWSLTIPLNYRKKKEKIKVLTNIGIDLTSTGMDLTSDKRKDKIPLLLAAVNKHSEIVSLITKLPGADVNVKDSIGDTALHLAVINNDIDTIKILLGAGADRDVKNFVGDTPLDIAKALNRSEIVSLLERFPADKNALFNEIAKASAQNQVTDRLKELVKLMLLGHVVDANWNTPLHIAAMNGGPDVTLWILGIAPQLITEKNKFENTPIDVAVEADRWKVVEALTKAAHGVPASSSAAKSSAAPTPPPKPAKFRVSPSSR